MSYVERLGAQTTIDDNVSVGGGRSCRVRVAIAECPCQAVVARPPHFHFPSIGNDHTSVLVALDASRNPPNTARWSD